MRDKYVYDETKKATSTPFLDLKNSCIQITLVFIYMIRPSFTEHTHTYGRHKELSVMASSHHNTLAGLDTNSAVRDWVFTALCQGNISRYVVVSDTSIRVGTQHIYDVTLYI